MTPADRLAADLAGEFISFLDLGNWSPSGDDRAATLAFVAGVGPEHVKPKKERRRALVAALNAKFLVNEVRYKSFIDREAKGGLVLNHHEKGEVEAFFDHADSEGFNTWWRSLTARYEGAPRLPSVAFDPAPDDETLAAVEARRAGNLGRYAQSKRRPKVGDTLAAAFKAFVFSSFDVRAVHEHLNADCQDAYYADYFEHLKAFYLDSVDRRLGLYYLTVDAALLEHEGQDGLPDAVLGAVEEAYAALTNHCYLAVRIEPLGCGTDGSDLRWSLYADLVLYAEKLRAVPLQKGYFRPEEIQAATAEYVEGLDETRARFDLAHEGFTYKDCFVVRDPSSGRYDLLVLLQKHERDETPIPCPSCRSLDVRGNSYPTLGVRSWECMNAVCPGRSASDRGRRYSLEQVIKQDALGRPENAVPKASVLRWKLDVVDVEDPARATLDVLLRHYTLWGDPVRLVNHPELPTDAALGRHLEWQAFPPSDRCRRAELLGGPLFARFAVDAAPATIPRLEDLSPVPGTELYCGEASTVLARLDTGSVDGAVTSPPYYNAKREYAEWSNMYCYLYDIYNVARQTHRVLKDGAPFLYNVFDYFDNERTVAFSAMGDRRMILGAYIIPLFELAGFTLVGNVPWFKGEIEGKRAYNQGNFGPYYQAPLNAWEHVLVFSKGRPTFDSGALPDVLEAKPVYKMVRGKNVLGHVAPFPSDVPGMLLDLLPSGTRVLDMYSGSMTTGLTAHERGYRSISVDYKPEYCQLGLDRLLRVVREPELAL